MSMQINKCRVEMLSVGVFAMVMTIVVLNVHIPDIAKTADSAALLHALADVLPALSSYVISFIVLSMYWTTHHAFFHNYLKTINAPLMQMNMVSLLFLCLIPFSTELLAKFPANPT